VLALDPQTGALKWHYQFTPHDLHDWDATETPLLVDTPRKLLLQGNRNGFFYVLDRTNGKLLSKSPFVHGLAASEPTVAGARACPSMDGATNWMSTAFDPAKGLFFLMALEKCSIFSKSPEVWKAGESYYGGGARDVPGDKPRQYLRAIDLATGNVAWEIPQPAGEESWGGVLATASGLVFYCDGSGAFAAVDSATGAPLWHMQLNTEWKASPMTYLSQNRQYVAVAAGSSVVAFALEGGL
jgi:alcohol dehydrogenase (cytochrome c)